MMTSALVVLHVLLCLGLIATVLLQSGRSAGFSGVIAGGAETLFGRRKKKKLDRLFAQISVVCAVGFLITSLALTVLR